MPGGLGSRPAFASLQFLHGRIAALPEREFDALQDEIVNLAAFLERGLPERLINALGQIDARMDNIRPGPAASGLALSSVIICVIFVTHNIQAYISLWRFTNEPEISAHPRPACR